MLILTVGLYCTVACTTSNHWAGLNETNGYLISVSLYRPEWEDSRPWSLFEDTALEDVDKNQP